MKTKAETPDQRKLRFIRHAIDSRIKNAKAEVRSLSKCIRKNPFDYDTPDMLRRRYGFIQQIVILQEIELYEP